MGYPRNKNDDPAEFEDVYAGPGMMNEIDVEDPAEPEEAGEPAQEPETEGRTRSRVKSCGQRS